MADQVEPSLQLRSRFGVGCAQFAPKNVQTRFRNFDAYIEQLEKSLGVIAAIQRVDIASSNSLGNFENEMPAPFPRLTDDEFPFIVGQAGFSLDIAMHIAIPTRTQRELLKIDGDVNWHPFEMIVVIISHNYTCPIMVVESDNNSSNDPSDCVVLVSRFLEAEMNGPTPFHANFYVYERPGVNGKYTFEIVEQRGYDEVKFFVQPRISPGRSIEELIRSDLTNDLDVFYSIILERNNKMSEWAACFGKINKYETERKHWGIARRFIAFFIPPFKIYDSMYEITAFRLKSISAMSEIEDRISRASVLRGGPIWSFIKNEIKTFPNYDVDSLEKLIDYVDKRQARHQIIIYTLIAAIVGGIVGGFAGVLVKLWISVPGAGGN